MEAAAYRKVLEEVLKLQEGDPVAVVYRHFAHGPTPPHGLPARVPTIGRFVRWQEDCIVFRSLSGALYVDPLDNVYVSAPDTDEFNKIARHVESEKSGRRISIVGPGGVQQ